MKCFDHPNSDAIGICRSCMKGLCAQCALDTGDGLACGGRCDEAVVAMGRMVRSATCATRINTGIAAYLWPAFYGALGAAFIILNVVMRIPAKAAVFTYVMGALFVIYGMILGIIQYRWRRRAISHGRAETQ